ncbi:hypothetical protein KI688_011125 [Linnemannia hyalina]|uniref:Vacuolar import and degradation protein-domain-containing protein n=1 Tax=Linnemannia hyalina TaxID=64524 RepID=A0A9P7XWN0_9FUNG|nr:hypothetical protein KI688_011125 [Linnemannia hyalina]
MSGLRSYILDEDPESPATLHSSPPPPSRRHQQQQQQQQQASNAPRTTAASSTYPRLRALYLHSDADASSDFSELELHRPVPSSSGGEGGLGDFSDYETPLPGRWDLAAHWHMGEYYSEGVEGDADDDDDEDRDLDTDLSEGPTPGPGLRAGRWTGGSDSGMQLDMGRVRDILSSPISTPIAFNNIELSSRTTTSDSVTTAGPSASTGTSAGGGGSMFSSNLIGSMADIDSSTSEDILSSHHRHQHRPYQPHTNAPERSVRFSRDAAPPTRPFQTPQPTADINTSTPTLEPMTPEIFTPVSGSNIGTNTHDVDDIMQSTRSLTEIVGGTLGSLNQYRSSTRPQAQPSSGTGQDSSLGGSFDHSGHSRVYSPSRLTDFTGQGSSRSQFVRYPLPPGGGNGQSRLAGGSGGGGGGRGNGSLQQPQHHHLFALAASNRHGLVSSPRGHHSPYWGAQERSRRHGSQSPRYSSTSSPNSSTSSSRIGSPVLGPQSAVLKSQETEDGENGLMMTEQQGEGHRLHQLATCNTLLTGAREGGASQQASGMSQGIGISRQQQGASRQGSSILATDNEQKITSLPSFASSVFMPVIQGTTLIPCETYGPSGMYRRSRTNHPRRPCCFLQAGQKFNGTQSLKTMTSTLSGMRARQVEEWNVKVSISAVDYYAGTVCGHMEAMDVPMSVSNVVTFWEGEIVDFDNHTLWTRKWAAKEKTDLDHWRRLEAFRGMDEKHIIKGAESGRFKGQVTQKYIFMRWKERHFVNVSEQTSGLTIAGFYYVSMRRSDGYVEGFYHDQASTPFQHISLNPTFETAGFSSPIFEFA